MILTCGTVTAVGPFSTVVGAPPQWADDSDSTYVNFPFQVSGGVVADYAEAPLIGTPVAGVTAARLFIRCVNEDSTGSLLRATVIGEDGESITTGLFDQPAGTFEQEFVEFDGVGPFGENSGAANIAEVFAQPAKLRITWAAGAGGVSIRVVKAYVVVEAPITPEITGRPDVVRRRFVRTDD